MVRISCILGFVGILLSFPLMVETLIIHDIGKILELKDIEKITLFLVYIPLTLGLIGISITKWFPDLSGTFLVIAGFIILIPGIGFGLIYYHIIWGVMTGLLFLISGVMILFNWDKKI